MYMVPLLYILVFFITNDPVLPPYQTTIYGMPLHYFSSFLIEEEFLEQSRSGQTGLEPVSRGRFTRFKIDLRGKT